MKKNKQRIFTLGDIHGELNKLKSCLEKVNFDYDNDVLIQLGDIVDRGPDSYGCVEELLKIKNLIAIQGNHDEVWFNYFANDQLNHLWKEGGLQTYESYKKAGKEPMVHFDFFNSQLKYYIDDERRYFVHGGFNRHHAIDEQPNATVYTWDRDLWMAALSYESMRNNKYSFKIYGKPKEIFIGHTPTTLWGSKIPLQAANIHNIDTGCGKGEEGLLTIMNVETKEFWQS